jgi:hypothetical protein
VEEISPSPSFTKRGASWVGLFKKKGGVWWPSFTKRGVSWVALFLQGRKREREDVSLFAKKRRM